MRARGRWWGRGSPGAAVPRRRRRPGLQLAAAVLLAAALVAVAEAAVAAHLSARAALDDLTGRLTTDVRAMPDLTAPADGARRLVLSEAAAADLARLRGHESLDDAALLDREGGVLARANGRSGPAASGSTASGSTRADVATAISTSRPVTSVTGDTVTITVPCAGGRQVLRVVVAAQVLRGRATATRTPFLVVLGVGVLVCVPLTFVAGGTRLVRDLRTSRRNERTDVTTGLANGRALAEDLPRAVERAGRLGHPLALLLVEVNGLTAVADADGRAAAEALRRACAQVVADEAVHAQGRAYRLGDGRLGAILAADVVGCAQAADRVRAQVAAVAAPVSADAAGVVLDHRCPDAESLLIGAEQALAGARERRALVELFAAIASPSGAPAPSWVRLADVDGSDPTGPAEGPDPDSDIWDLDWFDDRP